MTTCHNLSHSRRDDPDPEPPTNHDLDSPLRVVGQPLPRVSNVIVIRSESTPLLIDPRITTRLSLDEIGAYVWFAAQQEICKPVCGRLLAKHMEAQYNSRTGEFMNAEGHVAQLVHGLMMDGFLEFDPTQQQRLAELAEWEDRMASRATLPAATAKPSRTASTPRIPPDSDLYEKNADGGWGGPWPLGSAKRPPRGQSVVYVLFGHTGRAVYVGSTDNFLARMKAHQASGKKWNSWIAIPCASREEAYEVEAEYLTEYMPHLNVQGPRQKKVVAE